MAAFVVPDFLGIRCPRWNSLRRCAVGAVAAALSVSIAASLTAEISGFVVAPFDGPSKAWRRVTVLRRGAPVTLGTPLAWKRPKVAVRDPYLGARENTNVNARLPWPEDQTELMIDATALIKSCIFRQNQNNHGMEMTQDPSSYWPARIHNAAMFLVPFYGLDRPPSEWHGVTIVYDLPDPKVSSSGNRVVAWEPLYKQAPYHDRNITFSFAQTHLQQHKLDPNYPRSDKEQLWMLEVLTRDFPRKQVLITSSKNHATEARRYCTVRGLKWFEDQVIEKGGPDGLKAVQALRGENMDPAYLDEYFRRLLPIFQYAFRAQ